jgi:uncharacterized protein YqeY
LLEKMIKQRRESIRQYEDAKRSDLADIEKAEIVVLQEFMPAALGELEIDAIILQAISDSGAVSPQEMGKVIALVKPLVAGRADMGAISQKIKSRLSGV